MYKQRIIDVWKLCLVVFGLGSCFLGLGSCRFFLPHQDWDVNHRFTILPPQEVQIRRFRRADRFSFAFFADIQVDRRVPEALRAPVMPIFSAYIRDNPVDFLVSGGDNTEQGWPEEYQFVDDALNALNTPIYWCLGNHDLFGEGWSEWVKRYGSSMRVLRVRNSSIYILDNANGIFGVKQRQWLERLLREDTSQHRFVVMHYPMFVAMHFVLEGQAMMREAYHISDLFERYGVRHVLMGHSHAYRVVSFNGVQYITAAALKETSPSKMFLRVDVGERVQITNVPLEVPGYLPSISQKKP
ncbi:MAG: metallophosphoesterase [Myxococcota bacterium]